MLIEAGRRLLRSSGDKRQFLVEVQAKISPTCPLRSTADDVTSAFVTRRVAAPERVVLLAATIISLGALVLRVLRTKTDCSPLCILRFDLVHSYLRVTVTRIPFDTAPFVDSAVT